MRSRSLLEAYIPSSRRLSRKPHHFYTKPAPTKAIRPSSILFKRMPHSTLFQQKRDAKDDAPPSPHGLAARTGNKLLK